MRPETFGQVADGRYVQKITLRSEQLTVTILTLGAVINDVRLTGVPWPLTLGSTDVAGYEGKLSSFGSFM
jgi:aldose 1-epimerase